MSVESPFGSYKLKGICSFDFKFGQWLVEHIKQLKRVCKFFISKCFLAESDFLHGRYTIF